MNTRTRLLAVLNAALLLSALGCGDEEGGCGPAPKKDEEPAAGGGISGAKGSSSGAADLHTSDRKGRVPKAYQRPASAYEPGKSTATISKPVIAVSSATAAASAARRTAALPVTRVTKRRVDGVVDRVELTCRIMASSPDGKCASAPNYHDIKLRCCPDGLIERCTTTMSGVIVVGRDCEPPK